MKVNYSTMTPQKSVFINVGFSDGSSVQSFISPPLPVSPLFAGIAAIAPLPTNIFLMKAFTAAWTFINRLLRGSDPHPSKTTKAMSSAVSLHGTKSYPKLVCNRFVANSLRS